MSLLLTLFLAFVGLILLRFLVMFVPTAYRVFRLGTNSPGFFFFLTSDRSVLVHTLTQFSQKQTSGWYHLWFGPVAFALTSDADYAKAVLTAREGLVKQTVTAATPSSMRPWSMANLVSTDGEQWKRQRSVFNPAFGSDAYKAYFPTFQRLTNKALQCMLEESLKSGGDVDTQPWMNKFTLDLLGESIFHYDFGSLAGTGDKYYKAYEDILQIPRKLHWRFFAFFLEKLPLESTKRFLGSQKTMRDLFTSMLEGRKKNPNTGKADVLDYILSAVKSEKMSEAEVYSNFWILFIAGHDTTATALTWELQMLLNHPEEQEKLYQEVVEVIGDREVQWEDLKHLKQMTYFIQETLRLFPPAAFLPTRVATSDLKIGDITIPKGITVGIDIRSIQRNPKYWPDPTKFDPSRFTPERMKGQHRFSYLPFSLGKRECIGNNFSLQEQHLFLASLLQKYRVEKSQTHPLASLEKQTRASIFNAPENGWVRLVQRK